MLRTKSLCSRIVAKINSETMTTTTTTTMDNDDDDDDDDTANDDNDDNVTAWRKMESGTCGLHGTVHVSTIASSTDKSQPCHGSMSDWNTDQCRAHSQLWLSLAGPCRPSSRHLRVDTQSTVAVTRWSL